MIIIYRGHIIVSHVKEKMMKQKKIVKEFKKNGDGTSYLEFTDEELGVLGLEKGDSVEWMDLGEGEIWKKLDKKRWSI